MDLEIPLPSSLHRAVPAALDAVIMRALERDRDRRFASAAEMATALEEAMTPATPRQVGEWVLETEGAAIRRRREQVARIESQAPHDVLLTSSVAPPSPITSTVRPRSVFALLALAGVLGVVGWGFTRNPKTPPSTKPSPSLPAATAAVSLSPTPSPMPVLPAVFASAAAARNPVEPAASAKHPRVRSPASSPKPPAPLYSRD